MAPSSIPLFAIPNKEFTTICYFVCYNQTWAPWILRRTTHLNNTTFCPRRNRPHTVLSHFKEPKYVVTINPLFITSLLYPFLQSVPIQQGGKLLFFEVSTVYKIQEFIWRRNARDYKNRIPFNYGWFLKSVNNARHPFVVEWLLFISDETNLIISYWNAAEASLNDWHSAVLYIREFQRNKLIDGWNGSIAYGDIKTN